MTKLQRCSADLVANSSPYPIHFEAATIAPQSQSAMIVDSGDLKDYLGDYSNPGYGTITIDPGGDKFKVTLNKVSRPLEHYHDDLFQAPEDRLDPLQKMKVQFHTDLDGDIASISMPLQPHGKDIVFTRMPDRQLTQRSFVEAFTGDYEIQGSPVPLKVSLRGENSLIISVPGQPDYKLNPMGSTTFCKKKQTP